MPSSELSYDAYRFRRINDPDPVVTRPKNIAKVEPYSMNTHAVRPLYQSASPTTATTTTKARIHLNSMGNTPSNSSTSSSAGSLAGMIRHSDFLIPQSFSIPAPPQFFSDSLSHSSVHQLPAANLPSYNEYTSGLPSSKKNSQDKYQSSSFQRDFQPSMVRLISRTPAQMQCVVCFKTNFVPFFQHPSSPSLNHHHHHPMPINAYHYRPLQNNTRQQVEMPVRSTVIEEQQQADNQQARRRFQRRKQMKRSKSVDLYQEQSSFNSPLMNHHDSNRFNRPPQRAISREYLEGGGENLFSSSSSSSLTADMERVNRAALLRYKSLDSITYNNRKSNNNGRNSYTNRRTASKPVEFDFDSDDSVCGIPKPRK